MHICFNRLTTCTFVVCFLVLIVHPTRMCGQNRNDYNYAPTISHYASNYQYQYFAEAGPNDRHPVVKLSSLPPIPGLKYRSCFYMCPVDTCYANRAVIALRCPDVPILRKWVSSRAEWFSAWCESDDSDLKTEYSNEKNYPDFFKN